jgi:acyl carrier protein
MKFATPSSSLPAAPAGADTTNVVSLLPARAARTARARVSSDPALELVRRSLAQHLGIEREEIDETQSLEEGLGLDPLDLVLIVLRLEELGEVEFPVGDLAGVATVADLTARVRDWWWGARCAQLSERAVSASRSRSPYRR